MHLTVIHSCLVILSPDFNTFLFSLAGHDRPLVSRLDAVVKTCAVASSLMRGKAQFVKRKTHGEVDSYFPSWWHIQRIDMFGNASWDSIQHWHLKCCAESIHKDSQMLWYIMCIWQYIIWHVFFDKRRLKHQWHEQSIYQLKTKLLRTQILLDEDARCVGYEQTIYSCYPM